MESDGYKRLHDRVEQDSAMSQSRHDTLVDGLVAGNVEWARSGGEAGESRAQNFEKRNSSCIGCSGKPCGKWKSWNPRCIMRVPAVLRVNRRFGGKICGAAIDNRGNLIESFVPNSLRIRFERSAQRTLRCAHFLLSPRQSQKSPFFPSSLPAVLRSPATITTRVTTVRSIWSENRGSWN